MQKLKSGAGWYCHSINYTICMPLIVIYLVFKRKRSYDIPRLTSEFVWCFCACNTERERGGAEKLPRQPDNLETGNGGLSATKKSLFLSFLSSRLHHGNSWGLQFLLPAGRVAITWLDARVTHPCHDSHPHIAVHNGSRAWTGRWHLFLNF